MEFKGDAYIFIQDNAFENVVWKTSAILSQLQYMYINHSE